MDDWDDFDDWSETEEYDGSDTWDDVEEEAEAPWGDPLAPDDPLDDSIDAWDDDHDAELDDAFDGPGESSWDLDAGGGGAALAAAPAAGTEGGTRMSAWEFGLATAVAGWLLDQQADRIVDGIRSTPAQPAAPGDPADGGAAWRRLPDPGVNLDAARLTVGEPLDPDRLAATIAQRLAAGRDLALEAAVNTLPAAAAADGFDSDAASFTIVVTDLVRATPVWVLLPERPGGFSRLRLQPVFADEGPRDVACCFVDSGPSAVAVVVWALARYHLTLADFRWQAGF